MLHGLPVGVKDIIDTADMPTEYGTKVTKAGDRTIDATIVARLRAAGAIVLGKTVTSEYALYVPGPTRKSTRHDPHAGGLVERLRCGCRGRHGSGRTGDPNQRLDHPSGVILRRRGLQTQPRHFAAHRDPEAIDHARPAGPDGADSRRRRLRGGCHQRTR